MGSWANMSNILHGSKPTLIMLMVQTIFAVVNIGYKLASYNGMPLPVLVAYRFLFGAAFIVPVAFIVERKKRPKLTMKTIFYAFLCGLFGGSLGQNLYLKSLALTSATFASAMTNLIPAMTFIVAICLRLERLNWQSSAGKAKVLGTLLGLCGAMLLTLYKGPKLNLWDTNINLLEVTSPHHDRANVRAHQSSSHDLVVGAFLSLASCACYSLWLIVQAKAAEDYPCPYSITAMMTIWGSIQSVVFALSTTCDRSSWILGWNIRLITAAFAGTLGSGVMLTLIAWCIRMRGPLFVSVFNPLLLVLVAIAGFLFLEEKLHLGLVLGAILIVAGLYVVLWGKGKELKKMSQLMPESSVGFEMSPPPPPLPRGGSGRGGGDMKMAYVETEEYRSDSQASNEVVGGLYIHP